MSEKTKPWGENLNPKGMFGWQKSNVVREYDSAEYDFEENKTWM